MLFQKKVNRALDKLHKESEAARQDMDLQEEGIPLEKNDFLAMVISAFLVFLPTALLVLGGIALIGYFFLEKKFFCLGGFLSEDFCFCPSIYEMWHKIQNDSN